MTAADITELLAHPDRTNAGATVPPDGLYLNKIIKAEKEE